VVCLAWSMSRACNAGSIGLLTSPDVQRPFSRTWRSGSL
jgi:hypothetical protein